jgi:sec-independent protein translocase protein TatC
VQNLIQAGQYLSFAMAMMLAFGLAFELPLLIVMLNQAGVLTHERFRRWRRVLIFTVFLTAGLANPSPDPVTMLILGGACAVLVEAAELLVWAHDRRRARLHPDPIRAWPTTSCPRCNPPAGEGAERCSTCPCPSCWFSR